MSKEVLGKGQGDKKMFKKMHIAVLVALCVAGFAGSRSVAAENQADSTVVTCTADSCRFPFTLAGLENGQANSEVDDVNEQALLSAILDRYIEEEEEDPNEPEKHVPLGGGGFVGSSGLHASNPFDGSSGAGGLMPAPAPTTTRSAGTVQYTDTYFAAPVEPVENDSETVTPTPYIPDGTTTVPEPTTIAILGLGSMTLLRRRKST